MLPNHGRGWVTPCREVTKEPQGHLSFAGLSVHLLALLTFSERLVGETKGMECMSCFVLLELDFAKESQDSISVSHGEGQVSFPWLPEEEQSPFICPNTLTVLLRDPGPGPHPYQSRNASIQLVLGFQGTGCTSLL